MTGQTEEQAPVSARTAAREAFFLDFAKAIRNNFKDLPLMVTGGFRTRKGMESAVSEGACDIVGIGRPAVLNPLLPKNMIFNHEVKDEDAKLYAKIISTSWLSKLLGMRSINGAAETVSSPFRVKHWTILMAILQVWYVQKIHNMLKL